MLTQDLAGAAGIGRNRTTRAARRRPGLGWNTLLRLCGWCPERMTGLLPVRSSVSLPQVTSGQRPVPDSIIVPIVRFQESDRFTAALRSRYDRDAIRRAAPEDLRERGDGIGLSGWPHNGKDLSLK